MGRPVFSLILLLAWQGTHKREDLQVFSSTVVKVAKIFSAMSVVGQMCCYGPGHGAGSKFSVKRNLLEKAFAYPRGNVSVE